MCDGDFVLAPACTCPPGQGMVRKDGEAGWGGEVSKGLLVGVILFPFSCLPSLSLSLSLSVTLILPLVLFSAAKHRVFEGPPAESQQRVLEQSGKRTKLPVLEGRPHQSPHMLEGSLLENPQRVHRLDWML